MAVLTRAVSWSKPSKRQIAADLSSEESAAVKRALRFLQARFGTWPKLARAMGVTEARLRYAASKRGTVSAGIAIKTARVAAVCTEDVLTSRFPPAGECPHCGRA